MAGLAQMLGIGGGMPSPEEMAKLAQQQMPGSAGGLPPNIPGLPPAGPGGGPNIPGLPGLGKFPGLGGGGGGKLPTPGGLPPDFFKKK
jgi:signal recognition particle subunit SRP54